MLIIGANVAKIGERMFFANMGGRMHFANRHVRISLINNTNKFLHCQIYKNTKNRKKNKIIPLWDSENGAIIFSGRQFLKILIASPFFFRIPVVIGQKIIVFLLLEVFTGGVNQILIWYKKNNTLPLLTQPQLLLSQPVNTTLYALT